MITSEVAARFSPDFAINDLVEEARQRLGGKIFLGKDLCLKSFESGGQVLPPNGFGVFFLEIPQGSFSSLVGLGEEAGLIRYLLSAKSFSVRSKLAQAGLGFEPLRGACDPIAEMVVLKDFDNWFVPVWARNFNQKLSLKFPDQVSLPVLRFYFRPRENLIGKGLVGVVEKLGLNPEVVKLADMNYKLRGLKEVSNLPEDDACFFLGPRMFNTAVLPVVRTAEYLEPKTIDMEAIGEIPSRAELDQALGLNWNPSLDTPGHFDFQIGETDPIIMPKGVTAVVLTGATRFDEEYTNFVHSLSVVIDPGFGLGKGGLPIRTEFGIGQWPGKRQVPKEVELFFFNSL